MQLLKITKVFDTNKEYKTEVNKFYVFKAIGSDVDLTNIIIDGREICPLDSTLSPSAKTSSNLFGLTDLGDLYLVVPPSRTFKFASGSSGKVVCRGYLGILSIGEGIPADYATRFENQDKVYIKPLTYTYDHGTDTTWSNGQEVTLAEITPTRIQRITLNNVFGVSFTNIGTLTRGKIGIKFYYDGRPLDLLDTNMGHKGIDAFDMPLPPTDTTNMEAWSFADNPLVIEPNHTLKITAINVSGSDITPPSGSSITVTLKMLVKFEELE